MARSRVLPPALSTACLLATAGFAHCVGATVGPGFENNRRGNDRACEGGKGENGKLHVVVFQSFRCSSEGLENSPTCGNSPTLIQTVFTVCSFILSSVLSQDGLCLWRIESIAKKVQLKLRIPMEMHKVHVETALTVESMICLPFRDRSCFSRLLSRKQNRLRERDYSKTAVNHCNSDLRC